MYSLASASASLLGAKSSRRGVARASRTFFSRWARRAGSEALGEVVVVLMNILPEYLYFTPASPLNHRRFYARIPRRSRTAVPRPACHRESSEGSACPAQNVLSPGLHRTLVLG